MKTRQAFVANSSSSSFIIAFRNIENLTEYEQLPKFARRMISKFINTISCGSGETFKTMEDFDGYFIDQYGWLNVKTVEEIIKDDDSLKELYNDCKAAIEQGYIIKEVAVDCNDEYRLDIFSELPDKDDGDGIYKIYGE